jgi:hypothetical protein
MKAVEETETVYYQEEETEVQLDTQPEPAEELEPV